MFIVIPKLLDVQDTPLFGERGSLRFQVHTSGSSGMQRFLSRQPTSSVHLAAGLSFQRPSNSLEDIPLALLPASGSPGDRRDAPPSLARRRGDPPKHDGAHPERFERGEREPSRQAPPHGLQTIPSCDQEWAEGGADGHEEGHPGAGGVP